MLLQLRTENQLLMRRNIVQLLVQQLRRGPRPVLLEMQPAQTHRGVQEGLELSQRVADKSFLGFRRDRFKTQLSMEEP